MLPENNENLDVGEDKKYTCGWCDYEFIQRVIKKERIKGSASMGRANSYSTPVKCPNCNNYLKTWD